jgi:hypothetical protein
MNRRQIAWFTALITLAVIAAASAPAFSQAPAVEPPAAEGAATPGAEATEPGADAAAADSGATAAPVAPPSGADTVETILRQQEDLLRGAHFTYDPEGRRDPFQSLFENVKKVPRDQRPRGVGGMMISEIDLDGIVQDPGRGNIAFFKGSDNKGYFLRVGDAVYDGTLIAIDAARGTVVFRQQVDDPRMIKPFRDVVIRLEAASGGEETTNE